MKSKKKKEAHLNGDVGRVRSSKTSTHSSVRNHDLKVTKVSGCRSDGVLTDLRIDGELGGDRHVRNPDEIGKLAGRYCPVHSGEH